MVLFVEAPTFDLVIVSLKQKQNAYILLWWSTQWDTLLISIRMMTLKMEINSEHRNGMSMRYIYGIPVCIVLSLHYSTKYNFL